MSWTITGTIVDPDGTPSDGAIVAIVSPTPARSTSGKLIDNDRVAIPVSGGQVGDVKLESVPGAVWAFLLPRGRRVEIADPGDGSVVNLATDVPTGRPMTQDEASMLRREWDSLREQTIDAVDTITSSVDAATQAAGIIADVVELKPKINQSITDAAAAKQTAQSAEQTAAQAVTSAQAAAGRAEAAEAAKFATVDSGTATLISNPTAGPSTQDALNRRVGVSLNSWPGVDPNGATECAAAIQAAIDHAHAIGQPVTGSGFFKVSTGITIKDAAHLAKCVFDYTGTSGIALTVGDSAGITRKDIATPLVIASAKTVAGWGQVAGTIGIRILNVESSNLAITGARNFEIGLDLYGQGMGVAYNNITLGELGDNKVNLRHASDATGWANQNTFYGGRLAHDGSEGSLVAGTRHILHASHASFPADGNVYVGTSLESPGVVEVIVESYGFYNQFIGCRWENFGAAGTKKIKWRGTAKGNTIIGGYEADKLTIEADSTTANNTLTAPLIDDKIWVPGPTMLDAAGAPFREVIPGGSPVVTLRDANTDGVALSTRIPSGWLKVKVEALYAPDRAGSGNVVIDLLSKSLGAGASYDDWPAYSGGGVYSSGSGRVIKSVTLATALSVTPGPLHLTVRRPGGDSADTYSGHIYLTGILVTRVA